MIELLHGRVTLALHELRAPGPADTTRPLLLLHGLGESTPESVPGPFAAWPGPVYGLDFTGHGRSTVPVGGGYTAEVLMADVDSALARLGNATVAGRGLGAYVALLIAGARPALVQGAVLLDGPGIVGGGNGPISSRVTSAVVSDTSPDPFALAELTVDVRPPDYAVRFVSLAGQGSRLAAPIAVCGIVRPSWLAAVVAEPGVVQEPLAAALARYA